MDKLDELLEENKLVNENQPSFTPNFDRKRTVDELQIGSVSALEESSPFFRLSRRLSSS